MTKTDQMLQYIAANPGVTSPQVAQALNIPRDSVGSQLSQLAKAGRVARRKAGDTITNVTYYAYYPVGALPTVKEDIPPVKERAPRTTRTTTPDLNALVDQLATSLADTLAQQVAAKLKDRLMEQIATTLPALGPPPIINAPERVRRRKLLIAGLLPQQAGLISQEFGDVFELSFWKDESFSKLRSMAESADLAITFTSKLPHAAESAIKSSACEVQRCPGGLTTLRDMLTRMYVENDQKEVH